MSGDLLTWNYPGNPVPKELKNFGGIYRLTFENKKFYIGQSINLFNRISEHIYKLKSNTHYNKKLQNTFNKYEGKIQISLLFLFNAKTNNFPDSIKKQILNVLEQTFFNIYSPELQLTYSENFFNDVWKANLSKVTKFSFISPTGFLFYGYNIADFCKTFNLDRAAMSRVKSGENTHHRGWTISLENHLLYKQGKLIVPESEVAYCLFSPEGKKFTGKNINKFSEELGLSRRSILRVAKNERGHHLGWTSSFENHKKYTQKVRLYHVEYGEIECCLYNIAETILENFKIKVSGHMFLRENVIEVQGWKLQYTS